MPSSPPRRRRASSAPVHRGSSPVPNRTEHALTNFFGLVFRASTYVFPACVRCALSRSTPWSWPAGAVAPAFPCGSSVCGKAPVRACVSPRSLVRSSGQDIYSLGISVAFLCSLFLCLDHSETTMFNDRRSCLFVIEICYLLICLYSVCTTALPVADSEWVGRYSLTSLFSFPWLFLAFLLLTLYGSGVTRWKTSSCSS